MISCNFFQFQNGTFVHKSINHVILYHKTNIIIDSIKELDFLGGGGVIELLGFCQGQRGKFCYIQVY